MSREPGRELMEGLGLGAVLLQSPANAWNPSITGARAEETFILTENGPEVITGP